MKENSKTCYKALTDYQLKHGDEALTENEKQFIYGVIDYDEFKRRVSTPQDEPFKILGIEKQEFVDSFCSRISSGS
jgi:hypothetical protein